jgi:hypothetical protein
MGKHRLSPTFAQRAIWLGLAPTCFSMLHFPVKLSDAGSTFRDSGSAKKISRKRSRNVIENTGVRWDDILIDPDKLLKNIVVRLDLRQIR